MGFFVFYSAVVVFSSIINTPTASNLPSITVNDKTKKGVPDAFYAAGAEIGDKIMADDDIKRLVSDLRAGANTAVNARDKSKQRTVDPLRGELFSMTIPLMHVIFKALPDQLRSKDRHEDRATLVAKFLDEGLLRSPTKRDYEGMLISKLQMRLLTLMVERAVGIEQDPADVGQADMAATSSNISMQSRVPLAAQYSDRF